MKIHEKLYIKKGIQLIINKINEVGRLKFRINMHSAAAIYSVTLGDQSSWKFTTFLKCGVVAFEQQVHFICYHMSASVKIFITRLNSNFR